MADSRATLVLVHWNQPERCLKTVAEFEAQGVPLSIVVVDNGSRAEALERLTSELPDGVVLLPLGYNAGFGPGANAGMRRWLEHDDTEWVLVAPHDARPQDDCVRMLLETLDHHPSVGLASADVGDGETPVIDAYFGSIAKPAERTTGFEEAAYPHGTLFAGRRACLRDIGLFDERYFAYCEEADLGLRAAAAGWDVGIVRDAQVRNPSMGPGPGPDVVDYLMHRNTLLLVREHSGIYNACIRFVIALIDLAKGLYRPSSRQLLYSARGRGWALVDFLRGRYGPPPAYLFPRVEPVRTERPFRRRAVTGSEVA